MAGPLSIQRRYSGQGDPELTAVGHDQDRGVQVRGPQRRHAAPLHGDSPLQVPDPVVIQSPYVRTITPSGIPDRRDDIVDGSLGLKLTTAAGLTIVGNGEWPLNRGGLRPDIIWTVGLEYNF